MQTRKCEAKRPMAILPGDELVEDGPHNGQCCHLLLAISNTMN